MIRLRVIRRHDLTNKRTMTKTKTMTKTQTQTMTKTKTKTMTKTEKVANWLRRLSLWQKQTNDSNLWG